MKIKVTPFGSHPFEQAPERFVEDYHSDEPTDLVRSFGRLIRILLAEGVLQSSDVGEIIGFYGKTEAIK